MANMYNKILFLGIFENITIASLAAFSSYEVPEDDIRKICKCSQGPKNEILLCKSTFGSIFYFMNFFNLFYQKKKKYLIN